MRLRPARVICTFVLGSLTALSACSSDNSPVEPGHTSPGPPVWSEITNLPAPVTLYGLWAPRPDYMIGVGRGGEIWQWDGQRWTQLPNSNPRNLNAIDGSTSGKVFAVGNGGTALEQVNGAFVARDLPVRNDLHDVWRSPSGQFCAVGDIGTVLRGDGTTWAQDSVATNAALLSVWGSSDTNIYAVSVDGDVLHFDGSTWKTAAHTPHMLTSIEGTGGTDVYAVGAGGTVLHYDGDAWTTLPSGTKDLLQACCASCGPAAAGANGSVAMWSNSAFTHQHINGAPWIYAMARAGSDTWAVGANALFRYDGATWALETRGTIPVLRGMTVTPSGNLMAAGDDGIVMNGSPSHWNIEDAGALQRVNAVWTSPAGDIFAAGTNRIFRRTANGWVTENSDIVEWYDIGGNSQHIFAVGKYGNIRERHGTTWSGVPGASYDLHAIRMDESGGYIVGDEGNILYYQAGGWGVKYTRAGVTFMDIEPVNTEQYRAIAVGSNGLSIGRSTAPAIGWTTMQTPVATTLYALARGPGGYLYAAGSSGTLLELVDEKWDLVPTPTSRTFYKLCEKDGALFLSGGDGAGGGVLFRYGSLNN